MVKKKTTKKPAKKTPVKKAPAKKVKYTHIDRSNGNLLREKDLNKKKPWLGPTSGQATVEKLTETELKELNQ